MTVFVPKAAGQHDDFSAQLSVQIKESNKAELTKCLNVYKKLLLITVTAISSWATYQRQYGFTNLSVSLMPATTKERSWIKTSPHSHLGTLPNLCGHMSTSS